MPVDIIVAEKEHEALIQNMMQFYIYDFSEFVDLDVNSNCLFDPYPGLSLYFQEPNRFAYLIKEGNNYIGFVLVRIISTETTSYFSMAEFFIMKKYRRSGIGKTVAQRIFNLHKGSWEIYQREKNLPAYLFWKKTIDDYTLGDFTDRTENGKTIQNFNSK